jgi:hypothetical protein
VPKKVVKARKRYAEGGAVQSPSLLNRLKGLYSASKDASDVPASTGGSAGGKSTPAITGGFADAIKRRQDRMDAVERGEADKLARGGKVKKRKK